MPAADELFRSTAGNATLLQNQRTEEPERERAGSGRIGVAPRTAPAAPQSPSQSQQSVAAPGTVPAQAQPSSAPAAEADRPGAAPASGAGRAAPAAPRAATTKKASAPRRPSGRERHDEKITVYVSPDELLGLEHARITLRGEYGVAVDRGRIVREAIAALLADLDARGPDSILVKRLSSGG